MVVRGDLLDLNASGSIHPMSGASWRSPPPCCQHDGPTLASVSRSSSTVFAVRVWSAMVGR